MKVRSGFVSNSSSSSFIIIGEADISFNKALQSKKETIYVEGQGVVEEGMDVFLLTDEIREHLAEFPGLVDAHCLEFHLSRQVKTDGDSDGTTMKVTRKGLPEEFEVIYIEKNYHSTETLEQFKENYPIRGGMTDEDKKRIRKQ